MSCSLSAWAEPLLGNQSTRDLGFMNPTGTKLEDLYAKALSCMKRAQYGWILDSGACKHVTGAPDEFISYTPYPSTYKETIQTVDGTC